MRSSVVFARAAMCVTAGSLAVGMFSGTAAAYDARPADNVVCDLTTQLQLPLLCPVPAVPVPTLPTPALPVPVLPVPVVPPVVVLPVPVVPSLSDDGVVADLLDEGGIVDEVLGDDGVVDRLLNGSEGGAINAGSVVGQVVGDVVGDGGVAGEGGVVGDGGVVRDGGVVGGAVDDLIGNGGTVDKVLCTVSQVLSVQGSTCPLAATNSSPVTSTVPAVVAPVVAPVVTTLTNVIPPSTRGVGGGTATNVAAGVRHSDTGGSSLPVTGTTGVIAMLGIGGVLSAGGIVARRVMRLRLG